jgi:hypothetical protein
MINGPKETLLYVICVQPEGRQKPDYLATVDIDPDSSSCGQVRTIKLIYLFEIKCGCKIYSFAQHDQAFNAYIT